MSKKLQIFSKDNFIVNLCDGFDNEGGLGECVVKELEKNKLVYTGSSKLMCKKSEIKVPGVSTPKCVVIRDKKYDEKMFKDLRFPLIMKPDEAGGSIGITEESKTENLEELLFRLKDYVEQFPNVVIEEYIQGREFTVLVCEGKEDSKDPIVFEPLECVFTEGFTFKSYDLKWNKFASCIYQEVSDQSILEKLFSLGKDTFVKLNLDGYSRLDIRMDFHGNLFVVDVNPNPGIFYSKPNYGCADFILSKSRKMNHLTFIEHLFMCGQRRAKKYETFNVIKT